MPGIIPRICACPQVATNLLAIAMRIVVIYTAGIVTLTHRTIVTTTIDASHHITVMHDNLSVAIDFSGSPTVEIFCC